MQLSKKNREEIFYLKDVLSCWKSVEEKRDGEISR